MKKVGIATMFGGANYGNVLQNYAVERLIDNCGYNPITLRNETQTGFVDYSWRKIKFYKKISPTYIKEYLRTRINNQYGCKNDRDFTLTNLLNCRKYNDEYRSALQSRLKKFDDFRSTYLHVDSVPITAQRCERTHMDTYTSFVCGSDQVWNPYYRTTSMVDFLQFAPEHKRIALAPSFGVSTIPAAIKGDYAKWLSEIPHLSVREDAGAKIIRELTGRDAQVLLDPTLCVTRDQWKKLFKEPLYKPQKDFVFCYFLGNKSKKYCRYIEKYANQNNCEIVDVCDIIDLRYYDCDPCEFLWLLSHARVVFTDSFHGTAFSINLQVPFVVFDRVEGGKSMSSRITTLLQKTGLSNRHYRDIAFEEISDVDFSQSDKVLSRECAREIEFLRNALAQTEKDDSICLANKYHCTGCGACFNNCSVGAISMAKDDEGFAYPVIDQVKCIGCKACEKACPADVVKTPEILPNAYAATSKDKETQRNSSSGGVFTHLAKYILMNDGVVFGAAYDNGFRVCHISIEDEADLYKLRTSKYVQSDINCTYTQTKDFLKLGKKVLFTGTPCQIAGLKKFLSKDYQNLYTQDIICHGVPSPDAFEKYLDTYHRNQSIRSISFRDKTLGWNEFSMRIEYSNGDAYRELATKDCFTKAFLADLNLRPSCYQCQYKTTSRISDLTLADYWGVETIHGELSQEQGVSLVLIHSEKGQELLKHIEKDVNIIHTDIEKAISLNHATLHSVACPAKRHEYFEYYKTQPMKQLVDKLLKKTFTQKMRRFIIITGSRTKKVLRNIKKEQKVGKI